MASEAPSPAEPGNGSDGADDEPERFGPLELHRFTKEDGRMLILYARTEPPEADEG
jgi:hypothetical protein